MGEGMISLGGLYCNGEPLGEAKAVEIELMEESEMCLPIADKVEVEFKVKIDHKRWRKILGDISQKRFRKLLYSVGYQRNQVNEIIEIEWKCKKSYNTRDIEYWRSYLDEI